MTLNLTLNLERETQLQEQARQAGLPLEEYALRVLDRDARRTSLPTGATSESRHSGVEEQVFHLYSAWNVVPLHDFLSDRPDVAVLLLEAWLPIQRVFGDGTNVTLKTVTDHENEHEVVVAARIQVAGTVTDALAKRKQFNREWWMRRPEAVTGPVQFDVEIA